MDQKPFYENLRTENQNTEKSSETLKNAEKINYTLYDISNAVNTTRNLKELYQSIYDSLNRLIPLPNFYIAIYDNKNKTINFEYFLDEYDDDFPIIENLEKPGCLTGEVILARRPLFLKENMLIERTRKNKIIGTVPKIWIGVPLIIKETVIGVVCVQHYSDPGYFSHQHLEILIFVSDQISVAIERQQILDALENKEKTLSLIFDTSLDSILITCMDTGIIFDANKAFMDLSGFDRNAVIGKTTCEIGMWKDNHQHPALITGLKENGYYKNLEAALCLNNKTIHALVSSKVLNLDGIPHIISIIRDITDKKMLEKATDFSENQLSVKGYEDELHQVLINLGMDAVPAMKEKENDPMSPKRAKTILVIEDEDMVRDMAVKALKAFGYNTLDACDGEAGLSVFKKNHPSIDAVLLDVIMPKMSGTETFKHMLTIDPKVKVIVASGHVTNQDQKKIFAKACAYLEKPYQIMELKKTLELIFK
ncbi:MAG: hypothetical protein A2277_18990 [Desulfobacterales bacterium RIFOXYA12_FULL_46_15]|nr:MAG: hypothetical protein A2097_05680 [Desulfobacula sp. GWF2_41_7]OGR23933.1 MAG: hypothetical protein A2277_18990 [Desulfobacterales bacterium RIFOXYA12_FULL_46_15]